MERLCGRQAGVTARAPASDLPAEIIVATPGRKARGGHHKVLRIGQHKVRRLRRGKAEQAGAG